MRSHSHLLISHPEAFEQLANPPPHLPSQLPVLAIKTLQCKNVTREKNERKKRRKKEKKKQPPNKYFPKEAKHSNPLQPSGTLLLL